MTLIKVRIKIPLNGLVQMEGRELAACRVQAFKRGQDARRHATLEQARCADVPETPTQDVTMTDQVLFMANFNLEWNFGETPEIRRRFPNV